MTQHDLQTPPDVWPRARAAMRALVSPMQRFLEIEAASGVLLLVASTIALVVASSSLAGDYHEVLDAQVGIFIGPWSLEHSVHFWINEGLMTLFFFVVGLEIRREIHEGELADLRRAALPLVAALGGVTVPALIYTLLNAGRAGAAGWAIPMATDIAFAVGILTLLGSRVPNALRVLLLGLAVIDDIAAIIVIAAFYSSGVSIDGLVVAAAGIGLTVLLRATGLRSPLVYLVPGLIVWGGLLRAGVHPTLAGVVMGLLAPVRPWFGPSGFREATASHLEQLDSDDRHQLHVHLDEIERARREAVSPAERLIHALHPWVAFLVMPVFALANAGVDLRSGGISGDGAWLFIGVVAGLAIGKPLGITGASLLATRAKIATRSPEMTAGRLAVVGTVGGIGFTMSLFIAELAFGRGPLLATAKLGVLVGSGLSMLIGLAYGALALRTRSAS